MAHIRLITKNSQGHVVAESVVPHGTEWFTPRIFEFRDSSLYIEESSQPLMPRWGRTVPPGGRLIIEATD